MNFTNPQAEQLCKYLSDKYKKLTLNKSELANEIGISESSINLNISKGLGPNYIKLGTSKNASVRFNIIDVAEYLSQTVKTA